MTADRESPGEGEAAVDVYVLTFIYISCEQESASTFSLIRYNYCGLWITELSA